MECSPTHGHRDDHDCGNLAPPAVESSSTQKHTQEVSSKPPTTRGRAKRQRANTAEDAISSDTFALRTPAS